MSRTIIIALLIMSGYRTCAQDSLTRSSLLVYGFEQFNIIIVSPSTTDSQLSNHDSQQQSPSKDRFITVRGQLLKILITTNKEPFLYPVKKVSFEKDRKHAQSTRINGLEVRSGVITDGSFTDWMGVESFPSINKDVSISLFPLVPGNLSVKKGKYYTLFEQAVVSYLERVVSFRNKKTKEEMLNIRINVIDNPIRPILAFALQGNLNQSLIDSLLKRDPQTLDIPDLTELLRKKRSTAPINVLINSTLLQNDSLFNTDELVLYFNKQRSEYPDSSIEYRLSGQPNKETNWVKSGHKLSISNLITGSHYKLQVRYQLHPDYIQNYTFYVVPKWYQSKPSKILFTGMLIFIALATSLLIYYNRFKKSTRRRDQLSLELKSIRSQLNPHFIFNALSSIQSLMNKNDIPAANLYLTSFSTLLRESLRNNEKEMVPLATEVNLLEIYLKLEQLRFNFKFEVDIESAINKQATEIPNLLIQPLVENAVKHGVSTLSEKGLIVIKFIKKEHDLMILVMDNGNMFNEPQYNVGFGLKLTRSRIALLNQTLHKQPIYLTLERSEQGKTIANLLLTNWF